MTRPIVVIIVLNWNNFEDTNNCVESLLTLSYAYHKVIVVDNDSTDNSLLRLKNKFAEKKIIFLNTGNNLGYAGGMNRGIEYALKNIDFDYIWLLNNDIKVKDDSLSNLVDAMQANTDSGIAGPTILFDDTNKIMEQYYALNLWIGRYLIKTNLDPAKIIKINKANNNYIGGAAAFMRKELLEKMGPIPEEYFMYNEDVAWHCKNKNNQGLLYVGPAKVWHKRSASSGGSKSVMPDYYDSRNFLYFIKNFYPLWLPYEIVMSIMNKVIPKILRGEWSRLRYVFYGFRDFFKGKTGKMNKL